MLLKGSELGSIAKEMINTAKQTSGYSLHLTLKSISKFISAGSVDFGGSEYQKSESQPVNSFKRASDDKYGWYKLGEGNYLVEFNERIDFAKIALGFILSLPRLLKAGAYIVPLLLTGETVSNENIKAVLVVGAQGIEIKENARIAEFAAFKAS